MFVIHLLDGITKRFTIRDRFDVLGGEYGGVHWQSYNRVSIIGIRNVHAAQLRNCIKTTQRISNSARIFIVLFLRIKCQSHEFALVFFSGLTNWYFWRSVTPNFNSELKIKNSVCHKEGSLAGHTMQVPGRGTRFWVSILLTVTCHRTSHITDIFYKIQARGWMMSHQMITNNVMSQDQ